MTSLIFGLPLSSPPSCPPYHRALLTLVPSTCDSMTWRHGPLYWTWRHYHGSSRALPRADPILWMRITWMSIQSRVTSWIMFAHVLSYTMICYHIPRAIIYHVLSYTMCYHIPCVIIYHMLSYTTCYHIPCVIIYHVLSYTMCYHIPRVIIYHVLSYTMCYHIPCAIIYHVLSYTIVHLLSLPSTSNNQSTVTCF